MALVVVVLTVGGAESVPATPGHVQAALAAQLVASDGTSALTSVAPFLARRHGGVCAGLESRFEVGNGVFKGDKVGWYASVWPSFQALNALYVTSLLTGSGSEGCFGDFQKNLAAIDNAYWEHYVAGFPPGYDQGPQALHVDSDYPRVDDSLWMGLTLMRAYARSGRRMLLQRAEDVFHLAQRNWDPRAGGVYWELHAPRVADVQKAVVSNAPAVILGVQLYEQTHKTSYLAWSERIFDWLRAHLFDPTTGLYDDHVDNSVFPPTVDTTKFTYNQGIMIGAMVALRAADPARYPIADAVELAKRSMAYFALHHSYGEPNFDVVWIENLLELAGRYGNAGFTAKARASAEAALRAAPPHLGDLGNMSSELALEELVNLPPRMYEQFFYAA